MSIQVKPAKKYFEYEFTAIGNVEGISPKEVIENLNQLQKILTENKELSNFAKNMKLDFEQLIKEVKNNEFDNLYDLIAVHFDHTFADVFVTGRDSVYDENLDDDVYFDKAKYIIKI